MDSYNFSCAPISSSLSEFSRFVLVPEMFELVILNLSTVKASVTGFPRGCMVLIVAEGDEVVASMTCCC